MVENKLKESEPRNSGVCYQLVKIEKGERCLKERKTEEKIQETKWKRQ